MTFEDLKDRLREWLDSDTNASIAIELLDDWLEKARCTNVYGYARMYELRVQGFLDGLYFAKCITQVERWELMNKI